MQNIIETSGRRFGRIADSAEMIARQTANIEFATRELQDSNERLAKIGLENEESVSALKKGLAEFND